VTKAKVAASTSLIRECLHRIGVDRAIFFSVGIRMWQVVATPISLFMIVRYLTTEEQGFYYSFLSLVGLQVFIELGMGGVLMQFVSHEWAGLAFSSDGQVQGDQISRDRFVGLVRLGAKWFAVGSIILLGFGLTVGFIFLSSQPHQVDWQKPWLFLVIAASLLITISPYFPILEGCHKVAEVAKVRMTGSIVATLVGWCALYLGVGLYVLPLMSFVTLSVYVWFIFGKHRKLLSVAWSKKEKPSLSVDWRAEFWPMQWRTALTWGMSYFTWQLYTLVLFYYDGPAAAGQMGISMSIAVGLYTVSLTWLVTKAPLLGTLRARQHTQEMQTLFKRSAEQSVVVYVILAVAAMAGLESLSVFYPQLAQRFLPPPLFGLLLISFMATLVVGNMAVFLRAFKKEPLVWVNVVTGLLVGFCVWQFGQRWGAPAMVLSLLLISIFVSLPWSFSIWYRQWKAMSSEVLAVK